MNSKKVFFFTMRKDTRWGGETGNMATAEEKYDVALLTEVVKTEELLISDFT